MQYTYDTTNSGGGFSNAYRLQKVTYPNGRIVWRTYGSGISDKLSRIEQLNEDSGARASHRYRDRRNRMGEARRSCKEKERTQ